MNYLYSLNTVLHEMKLIWTVGIQMKLKKKKKNQGFNGIRIHNFVNKGFVTWLLGKFSLWDTEGSPE